MQSCEREKGRVVSRLLTASPPQPIPAGRPRTSPRLDSITSRRMEGTVMDAGCVPNQQIVPALTPPSTRNALAWACYRFGLVAGGLVWICLACTLCGCGAANGYIMNQSGLGYYRQGNYTAARFEFERAMMDNPYHPGYAYNVAKAMEKQGDAASAERMYQHTLTLDPQHQPAYRSLAGLLMENGRSGEARQLVQTWADTQPYSAAAHTELAALARKTGDLPTAERHLQAALQIEPQYPSALEEMGQVKQKMGQPQQAAAFYQRSLAANPFQPQVTSRLGALATSNRPSSAITMANYMPQSDPTMAGGHIQASYSTRGNVMMGAPMAPQMSSGPVSMPMSAMPPAGITQHQASGMQFQAPMVSQPMGQGMPVQGQPVFSQPIQGPFPAGQPVELGQPVPMTQIPLMQGAHGIPMQQGIPVQGHPAISGVPAIQAF